MKNEMKYNKQKREEIKEKLKTDLISLKGIKETYNEYLSQKEMNTLWNIYSDLCNYYKEINKNNEYLEKRK